MRRVVIIGSGGSGKSTFATALGARLHLPVIHLDRLYWHPGWNATPQKQWRAVVAQLLEGDAWVMDGNYGGTMEQRLAACDTVVFLDLPRVLCLWRMIRRSLRYRGRSRPDMTPGCPERLTWEFAWWVWTYPRRRRPNVLKRLSLLPATTRVIHLRSTKEVAEFHERLR